MIGPEEHWPYDRPNLSKDFLAGELEAKWLPLRSPEFYEEHGIERLVARVTDLDVATRTLTLDDGSSMTPTSVLIASGSRPRRLSVPGADLPGVFTLRSQEDAEALVAAAADAERAVVVGASFIGMEAAASLVHRGLDVTVVGPGSTPFEHVLGADVGRVVQACHTEHGTRLALGRGVSRVTGDGAVRGVEFDDGTTLDADLVVVGIGVEPVTDYVRGVDIDPDGGLPVDELLRVAPGVWAAGDVARYREPHTGSDVRIEHWRLAEQHGRAAAADIAGMASPSPACPSSGPSTSTLARLRRRRPGMGGGRARRRPGRARLHGLLLRGDRLVAACGTQRDEIGAFVELMREGACRRRRSCGPRQGRPCGASRRQRLRVSRADDLGPPWVARAPLRPEAGTNGRRRCHLAAVALVPRPGYAPPWQSAGSSRRGRSQFL